MTIIGRILTNTINRGNNGARSESQEEFFSPFLSCFPTYVHTPHESCAVENNIFSRVCCSTNDGLLVCPAALDATFQSISAIWEAQSRKELESLELRVPTAFTALPETTAARIAFHVANLCRCAGGNAYAFVAQHRPGAVLSDDARDSIRRQKSFDEKINSLDPTSLQPAIQCLATRYLEAETKLYIPSKGFARSLRHLRNTSGDFMKVSLVLRPTLKTRSEWTMAVCTGIISAAAAWDSAMKDLHLPMVSSHVTMMFDI